MKNNIFLSNKISSNAYIQCILIGLLTVFFSFSMSAQEEQQVEDKPVRAVFESVWLIDNQTVVVPYKGTFEFDIQHRFGTLQNGYDDFWGLYSNSNIRMGFSYAPMDDLFVGFGLTKFKHIVDLNWKYALLKQTRSGKMPVSITYFGNMAFDTRSEDRREEVFHTSDRISYFHQAIIGRKFNDRLSLQIAPSISHYNIVDSLMNNDHIAVAVGAQIGLTDGIDLLINVDQPITKHSINNPNPNVSLGIQMVSSSHAFQIFLSNSNRIVPQEINMFNDNNYDPDPGSSFSENFLIGFNITRLWNF